MVSALINETKAAQRSPSMKITSNRPVRTAPSRGSQRVSGQSNSDFSSQISGEPAGAGAVSSSTPITALDGILAVQEVPTATDGRSRGIKRGYNLLEQLDDIRLGLLTGAIPQRRLVELRHEIEEARETVTDPQLSVILDDIELRAAVELAKLDKAV